MRVGGVDDPGGVFYQANDHAGVGILEELLAKEGTADLLVETLLPGKSVGVDGKILSSHVAILQKKKSIIADNRDGRNQKNEILSSISAPMNPVATARITRRTAFCDNAPRTTDPSCSMYSSPAAG
jgi:hypothetical protein